MTNFNEYLKAVRTARSGSQIAEAMERARAKGDEERARARVELVLDEMAEAGIDINTPEGLAHLVGYLAWIASKTATQGRS